MLFSFDTENKEQDFTLKLNQQRIKCSRSVVQSLSPVLSNYIISHPNARGCACEIQKLPQNFELNLLSSLFSGSEIEINDNNFDLLIEISKNLKIEPLFEKLSSFKSANFTDEIKIEKLFSKLTAANLNKAVEYLKNDVLQNGDKNKNEYKVAHILLAFCICKPQKIELFVELIEKVGTDLNEAFCRLVFNLKRLTARKHQENQSTISCESELNFVLHQLYDRNLVDHLSIQTLRKLPLNFSDVLSNSCVNIEEDRIKKYSNDGINPNLIAVSLRIDDVETFSQISSFPEFEFSQKFDKSPFERCEFVNQGCYLIEYAAFFKSVKCFKFLCEKYSILPFNLAKFAVAGGCTEIIKICENKNCLFDDTLSAAIQYHRQKVVEWLVNDKSQIITKENVRECIEFANFTTLQYFLTIKGAEVTLEDLKTAVKYNLVGFMKKFSYLIDNPSKLIETACLSGNFNVFSYIYINGDSSSSSTSSASSVVDLTESLFYLACKSGELRIIEAFPIFDQNTLQNGLSLAVKTNNVDLISYFFKNAKINLEMKNSKGKTFLYRAAKFGNYKVVEYFLKRGANVNSINGKQGKTPLFIACQNGKVEATKIILSFKPEMNVKTLETLQTPLHAACSFGNIETVENMMSHSKEINANLRDINNRAPIHIACENNSLEIVSLLIKASQSALVIKSATDNLTPIEIAVKNGSIDMVSLFLEHPSLQITTEMLFTAVFMNHTEMVKLLLKQKRVYLNNRSKMNGMTALSQAVMNSNSEIIKLLLKQNLIDINAKNMDGTTALHIACREGKTLIFELLLKQEFIDINIKDRNGETPLHYACKNGHFDEARILLEQPEIEDYNVNRNGQTAEDVAATDEISKLFQYE